MSDSREPLDPAPRAGEIAPSGSLKSDDSRITPPLRVEREEEDSPSGPSGQSDGPNLFIAYGLIVLGLLVASALAALIVWPFYKAR